jgi:hypothetical protein
VTVLQELQAAIDQEPGFSLSLDREEKTLTYFVKHRHALLGSMTAGVSFKGHGTTVIEFAELHLSVVWEMNWRRGNAQSKASCVTALCDIMRTPSGLLAVRHDEAMKEQVAARATLGRWQTQLRDLTIALEKLR